MVVECERFEGDVENPERTVLLLPGYATSGACFARQAPLATTWDLRSLTLPPTRAGQSPIRELAGIVFDVAARFDRPVLLGTSFGGLVAIDAVARRPELFSGIVLVSTFARWPASAPLRAAAAFLSPVVEALAMLSGGFGVRVACGCGADAGTVAALRCEMRSTPPRERHKRLRAALAADLRAEAAAIALPTLIVHGAHDPVVPMSAGRELASLIPHSRWHPLDDAGHAPYLTHPAVFNRVLDDFLWRIAWNREYASIA